MENKIDIAIPFVLTIIFTYLAGVFLFNENTLVSLFFTLLMLFLIYWLTERIEEQRPDVVHAKLEGGKHAD